MSFSYNLATNIGKLRLKIQDTDAAKALFSDEELQVFLDEEGANLNLSAADALDVLANGAAQLTKSEDIGDYSYSAEQMAEQFRQQANRFRKLASGELADEPAFEIAEQNLSVFSEREIILNYLAKTSGGG